MNNQVIPGIFVDFSKAPSSAPMTRVLHLFVAFLRFFHLFVYQKQPFCFFSVHGLSSAVLARSCEKSGFIRPAAITNLSPKRYQKYNKYTQVRQDDLRKRRINQRVRLGERILRRSKAKTAGIFCVFQGFRNAERR